MSIVVVPGGKPSTITLDYLHKIASDLNIKIRPEDEEAYLLCLQGADAAATSVFNLPEYIDPRLAPVPTVGGTPRKFWKAKQNSLNAWSHQAELVAETPKTDLLKGKSIVMKDNMSVGGLPYTAGTFPQLADAKSGNYPISEIDCTILQRVLEAGAKVVGSATCENYSCTPLSYSSANGPVQNPWLKGHNAGGSTSGGACLLALRAARKAGVPGLEAAGEDVDIVMGGDQAGSIRSPSSYCGVYGLKPTFGLIPYTGIAGLHPAIDYTGPMAHTIDDIAVALSVMAGYDGLDPRMSPESPLRENVRPYHIELKNFTNLRKLDNTSAGHGFRVGIITESFATLTTTSEVAQVVRSAAETCFGIAGATVSDISVPMHALGPAIWAASVRNYMGSLAFGAKVPDILNHGLPHFSPRWPADQEMYDLLTISNPAIMTIIFGEEHLKKLPSGFQAKAHRHVLELRAAYDKALQDFDVLITPTNPHVAPPLPDLSPQGTVMEKVNLAVGTTYNTMPFNSSGHPAMNVPCGWGKSKNGAGWLPVGMQIIGKRWDEISVLKAARIFEFGGGGLGKWPGVIS